MTHVRDLQRGRAVAVPRYDFAEHRRLPDTRTAEPRRIIILEGILILAEPALRALMDFRVFVDTDADVRFIRRLQRDLTERGRTVASVVAQYLGTVRPMHVEFVEPSKRHAHLIIPEGGENAVAVERLVAQVRQLAD